MKNFSNILSIALKSILKNKRRNIFTMIGIIIGIAAVIVIMSLGNGFKKSANEQLNETGAAKNTADITYTAIEEVKNGENPYSPADIALVERLEGVQSAKLKDTADDTYSTKATNGRKNMDIAITKQKKLTDVDEGKGFTADQNELQDRVIIVSEALAEEWYKGQAIGKTVFIEGIGYTITGIKNDFLEDSKVYMPAQTVSHDLPHLQSSVPTLQVKFADGESKKAIANKVTKVLNKEGSGRGEGSYDYFDMEEALKSINKIFDGITYFVAAVAGISLFIAGIGVMNVMYISVAERSEEIAIRRAFGAKARDIELQFLVESVVLCLIGGVIGLLIGALLSTAIDRFTPEYIRSAISVGSVVIAVGVSTLIGIVFGWIPARAAAKKELIDIIK